VKRFVVALLGGLGIGALLRRRRRPSPVVESESSLADELRAKLAESRAAEAEAAAEPDPETALEARRREVHERARASIDELGKS
jgi:hypothetical protein